MSNTTSTASATCFCVGKSPDCTCGGRCRCECTCWKDKTEITTFQDWMTELKDPDLVPNGQKESHKTRGGKGSVGQAIAKDKKRRQLPPNCS